MDDLRLRTGTVEDASAIADVYRPYVEETAITFEETPPDSEEVANRIKRTLAAYPWFVAERDGEVVGYAYASRLRDRTAYRWTTELTAYVARDRRGEGAGTALYRALLSVLAHQGFRSAYGVVTLPNPASVALHERFGFDRVATFPEVGYKSGEWHDVAWYGRSLGERSDGPEPPTPFAECRDAAWLASELTEAVDDRGDRGEPVE